jgi:protein-L-isoaspartate(D-aspartate) O-methyltransferase
MTTAAMTADDTRRFLAEEIRVTANIRSPRIVDAIASVPRDRFLPPGPWIIRGMADVMGPPRQTDDADPRHVYHDISVAIDPSRQLYNGQPSLIARWLDEARIDEGQRIVHIGTGTGYFTALLAHIVGPTGRVHGVEIDPDLARQASANLTSWPWATVQHGNGAAALPADNDIVLVHAGATHVLDAWLDALRDGGRVLVPLTGSLWGFPDPTAKLPPDAVKASMPADMKAAMMANIGKGFMLLVTRAGSDWQARPLPMIPVAIYSLKDVRDEAQGAALGKAMISGRLMKVTRLRRDSHEAGETCVVHGTTTCLTAD